MSIRSILIKQEIELMMQGARRAFENDGCLLPNLFLLSTGKELYSITLSLPDTAEQKALEFNLIRLQLQARGLSVHEAVLFSETWFVNAQDVPAVTQLAPSQHPARQEAIVAVGRSADNRRYSQVIQPFTRDKASRPVWQPVLLATYDEPRTAQDGPTGILDFLFDGVSATAR
jgi:hypothetical protein